MSSRSKSASPAPPARVRVAQLLAFVALLAALVGSLGPAERVRTAYTWPPETLPEETPRGAWYTPLLLIAHRPEAISATLPCTLPPALPAAERPLNVLATARRPARAGALSIVAVRDELVFGAGDQIFHRARLRPEAAGADCAYRLHVGGGRWSLEEQASGLSEGGSLEVMPVVFGLFSELDLRSREVPTIEVVTSAHATRTTTRQVVAWSIAVGAIVAALLLVSVAGRPRRFQGPAGLLRGARKHASAADGVVVAVLLGWWVVAPAFFDDGWVAVREQMFAESRGFSHYYNTFGVNLPLDYWVEWLQHWVVQSSNSLLVQRLPSVLCLAAVWVVCRWTLTRILPSGVGKSSAPVWALASAFLVGALAWGMTLRPEPLVALLVVAILACVVRFLERESAAPVAAVAVLVPLALTAHPEGVVALAPALAAAPALLRWARPRVAVASTIAASAIALVAMLAFVGSDIEQRRADAQAVVEFGHSVAWRFELIRYTSLHGSAPLHRLSVALIALVLLAYLLWRRRERRSLHDVAALSLGIALLLLWVTPSKQGQHFGALMGLAAVAIAVETARLRDAARLTTGWARPLLLLAVAILVVVWSWAPRQEWNAIDLQTLDWTLSFEKWIDLSTAAAALPLVVLAVLAIRSRALRRREQLSDTAWRVVPWIVPLVCLPLVAFTVAVFAADSLVTSSWALGRQNLGAVGGSNGCGIADDLVVALPESARPASDIPDTEARPAWAPPAPVRGLATFALGPSETGAASTPWLELPDEEFGLYVAGNPAPGELVLERGVSGRGGTRVLTSDPFFATDVLDVRSATLAWRLLAAADLPSDSPSGANVFRIARRSPAPPGTPTVVSGPVLYRSEELTPRLAREGARTLVLPDMVSYFPCARFPLLQDGMVEVPDHIVATREGSWLFRDDEWSPFSGLRDLYRLERLSIADSEDAPTEFLEIFAVDRRVPDAAEAPPLVNRG